MIFGSVCSGIEAASAAWCPLGWQSAFMSEIEAFPRAVLTHHYPEVPLHGDFTTIKAREYRAIDVLVGGTPCQSFSVAGLRGGMADERGNLALEYLRLVDRLCPRWVVWENVPGVLSSGDGRDFGAFVGGLAECGYGWAYRVLDAQYFGLAQRRKRVFVVGCLGDWRRAAAVLFEPASLRGDTAPSRKTRERTTGSLAARTRSGGGLGTDFDCDGGLVSAELAPALSRSNPYGDHESREGLLVAETVRSLPRPGSNSVGNIAYALNAHGGSGRIDAESETFVTIPLLEIGKGSSSRGVGPNGAGFGEDGDPMFTLQAGAQHGIAHSLRADGFDASEDGTGRGTPLVFDTTQITSPTYRSNNQPGDPCHTLAKGAHAPAIAFQTSQSGVRDHDTHATLDANNGSRRHNGAIVGSAVRRLTPRECCRLQGFPDDYLDIIYRGKPAADGPKYRALGNSMAVPCMAWIGKRLMKVDQA